MNDTPRKKGVIFDLDGTLWNTSARIVPAWNEVLASRGLRQITTEDMNSYMGKTPDGIVSMMLPDLPREEGLAVFADCLTAEDDFLRRHGGILYPALEETLAVLRETYFLGIVSNCHTAYLDNFLDFHGLRHYFDDGETFGGTRKPKAENIRLLMERNSLQSAVYVGDTALDAQSAREAGIPFIFAAYGFGDVPDAMYVAQSFADLPALVPQTV